MPARGGDRPAEELAHGAGLIGGGDDVLRLEDGALRARDVEVRRLVARVAERQADVDRAIVAERQARREVESIGRSSDGRRVRIVQG